LHSKGGGEVCGEALSLIRLGVNSSPLHESTPSGFPVQSTICTTLRAATAQESIIIRESRPHRSRRRMRNDRHTPYPEKRRIVWARTRQPPTCCSPDASFPKFSSPLPPFLCAETPCRALFWRAVSAGCTKHAIERHELFAWEQGQSAHHHPE